VFDGRVGCGVRPAELGGGQLPDSHVWIPNLGNIQSCRANQSPKNPKIISRSFILPTPRLVAVIGALPSREVTSLAMAADSVRSQPQTIGGNLREKSLNRERTNWRATHYSATMVPNIGISRCVACFMTEMVREPGWVMAFSKRRPNVWRVCKIPNEKTRPGMRRDLLGQSLGFPAIAGCYTAHRTRTIRRGFFSYSGTEAIRKRQQHAACNDGGYQPATEFEIGRTGVTWLQVPLAPRVPVRFRLLGARDGRFSPDRSGSRRK